MTMKSFDLAPSVLARGIEMILRFVAIREMFQHAPWGYEQKGKEVRVLTWGPYRGQDVVVFGTELPVKAW